MSENSIKKRFSESNAAFPDPLASNEEKISKEYGIQIAKAIEREWFYRGGNGTGKCRYYDDWDKYEYRRAYARGEHDTKIHKDLLNI